MPIKPRKRMMEDEEAAGVTLPVPAEMDIEGKRPGDAIECVVKGKLSEDSTSIEVETINGLPVESEPPEVEEDLGNRFLDGMETPPEAMTEEY